ncbi:hypothetical protein CWN68_33675, partial [Klebsiella michiganensis]
MSASALFLQRRQSRPRLALALLSLLLLGGSLVHLGLGARWIAPQTVLQEQRGGAHNAFSSRARNG